MSSTLLAEKNGSTSQVQPDPWKRQSIRQFFSAVNWDDHPPEIQQLRATLAAQPKAQLSREPMSMKLSVQQFFNAVNWEDAAIAEAPAPSLSSINRSPQNSGGTFTLDDFSDLF
jgi:hypothetical protein